jgi:hypothetical protein
MALDGGNLKASSKDLVLDWQFVRKLFCDEVHLSGLMGSQDLGLILNGLVNA